MRGTGDEQLSTEGTARQHDHLPAVRVVDTGADANRRLPILLGVSGLQGIVETPSWRLLCVLFLRRRALSTDAVGSRLWHVMMQAFVPETRQKRVRFVTLHAADADLR